MNTITLKIINHVKFNFRIETRFLYRLLVYCFVWNGVIKILTKGESLISIAKKKNQNLNFGSLEKNNNYFR